MSDTVITLTYANADAFDLIDYSMGQGELTHYTADKANLTITLRRSECDSDEEREAFDDLADLTAEEADPDGELELTDLTVTHTD